jgi:hypothetical protein
MRSKFLLGVAAPALAALAFLSTAEPASAQYWYGSRGFGWGAAGLAAGIVGGALAVATAPLGLQLLRVQRILPGIRLWPRRRLWAQLWVRLRAGLQLRAGLWLRCELRLSLRGIFARLRLWGSLRQRRPQCPGSCPTCSPCELPLNPPGSGEARRLPRAIIVVLRASGSDVSCGPRPS